MNSSIAVRKSAIPVIASTRWVRGDLIKKTEIAYASRHARLAASAPRKDKFLSGI